MWGRRLRATCVGPTNVARRPSKEKAMSKRIGLEPATVDAEFTLPDPETDAQRVFVPVPLTRSREQEFMALQADATALEDREEGAGKNEAVVELMAAMVDVVLTSKSGEGKSAGDMLREGYAGDLITLGQVAGWFEQVVGAAQDPTSARK